MRRLLALLLALCLPALAWPVKSAAPEPRLRALLVGADLFVSQPNTFPAAENNLRQLARALRADSRGYERISQSLNELSSLEGFAALVDSAFDGAADQDVSLFYISTHGILPAGGGPMDYAMLLSDGQREHLLSTGELHQVLSRVKGRKLLIIDTCNAGALIHRGMLGDGLSTPFTTDAYRVLTASGGSEPSFFWSTGYGNLRGGSYFADALVAGISQGGRYAADHNRDGRITLSELHSHLLSNYAVATPQAYPLEDDFPVLCYQPNHSAIGVNLLSSLTLSETSFLPEDPELSFSFALNRRARLAYQLIYQKQGLWEFAAAQVIGDGELPDGSSLPGWKERSLVITPRDGQSSGYVMLMLTTVLEDSATPHAQALLRVEPAEGDPGLQLSTAPSFAPGEGEELPIRVLHSFPLRLKLELLSGDGEPVALLKGSLPTRPMHLEGGGSVLYWHGRLPTGEPAPKGSYRLRVSSRVGSQLHTATSDVFQIR